ncbi:hypothetical protein J6590_077636 [Homalodisca vitripennis]|nr:hypothetical protein J6590_077636 [Homalodisca vitripennis]
MDNQKLKAFSETPKDNESFKIKQRKARISGKPYIIRSKEKGYKEVSAKDPPFTQLFKEIHELDKNGQNTYLLGLIEILPVQRRRHDKYDTPTESRRQNTVSYIVPNGKGPM